MGFFNEKGRRILCKGKSVNSMRHINRPYFLSCGKSLESQGRIHSSLHLSFSSIFCSTKHTRVHFHLSTFAPTPIHPKFTRLDALFPDSQCMAACFFLSICKINLKLQFWLGYNCMSPRPDQTPKSRA